GAAGGAPRLGAPGDRDPLLAERRDQTLGRQGSGVGGRCALAAVERQRAQLPGQERVRLIPAAGLTSAMVEQGLIADYASLHLSYALGAQGGGEPLNGGPGAIGAPDE